jgi:uncharacterized protein (TIGR02271 family)
MPLDEPIVAAGIEYGAAPPETRPRRPLPPEDYPVQRVEPPGQQPYAVDPNAAAYYPAPDVHADYAEPRDSRVDTLDGGERTIELREEQLVARKELHEAGEVYIRTEVEEVPGRLEVDALREEVEVEHVPVGEVVRERVDPWEDDGVLVVPVYEEQLVVTKRLVLREHLRIRRVGTTERRLFEDTLRRERLIIEDPSNTGLVHEQYPTDDHKKDDREEGGLLGGLLRKALQ